MKAMMVMGQIEDRFRTKGLRPTAARIRVFEALLAAPQARSGVDALFLQLADGDAGVGWSTLYSTLRKLESHGLVAREWDGGTFGHKVVVYAVQPELGVFPIRFVCRHCKKSVFTHDPAFHEAIYAAAGGLGVTLSNQLITISMACQACAVSSSDGTHTQPFPNHPPNQGASPCGSRDSYDSWQQPHCVQHR